MSRSVLYLGFLALCGMTAILLLQLGFQIIYIFDSGYTTPGKFTASITYAVPSIVCGIIAWLIRKKMNSVPIDEKQFVSGKDFLLGGLKLFGYVLICIGTPWFFSQGGYVIQVTEVSDNHIVSRFFNTLIEPAIMILLGLICLLKTDTLVKFAYSSTSEKRDV